MHPPSALHEPQARLLREGITDVIVQHLEAFAKTVPSDFCILRESQGKNLSCPGFLFDI